MHAYAWYVWRKEPRSGPSFKVRVGRQRNDRRPVGSEPANAWLTAETQTLSRSQNLAVSATLPSCGRPPPPQLG